MNKMYRFSIPFFAAALFAACATQPAAFRPADSVDPYIGSGGHGHVFVGANVPRGMVQLGPHQPTLGWDWCSGYHYSDSLLVGFSHTRLSGTGIGDLGDILFMPCPEEATARRTADGRICARFDHADETVRPGYYRVLMENGVEVELTATARTGLHRYTFPGDRATVRVDLAAGVGWDAPVACSIRMIDERHIAGSRRSTGWAKDQFCYFYAEFSQPIAAPGAFEACDSTVARSFAFDLPEGRQLEVRVGISAVSEELARLNLETELAGRDFEEVAAAADAAWNDALGCIAIEPLDERQGRIFYTALYHTLVAPSLFSDVDGSYRGADGAVHRAEGKTYTTFSLWDTYRAASPLMTLVDPAMAREVAATMMRICDEQGKLPVWHLAGNETDCMVGNPGVIVLGDLVVKGFVEDRAAALEAMKRSSMRDERGMELLKRYGYIPFDKSAEVETVAKGMEFAISDAAVAKVARIVGDTAAAAYFGERSCSYRHYFDPGTQFIRGRASDGSFRTPFDPFKALHMRSDYTEGNAWQYTWLVPHDVHGLIALFGGEEPFLKKLDELFVAEGDLGPDANDVTGLIGQYAHGNEPSHHVAYLYNYVGEQARCARLVRRILAEFYTDGYDGICGNEDVGQMSAWYVLSSLGLYQVDPAGGPFLIGSPAVRRAVLDVGNGRTFEISAPGNSPEKIYVAGVRLNGRPYDKSWIDYADIVAGGTLEFEMSAGPTDFGKAPAARP